MAESQTKTYAETKVDSVMQTIDRARTEVEAVVDQTKRVVGKADRSLRKK